MSFVVSVESSGDYEWESDESPTGWNHATDNPTYTSYPYASTSPPKVTSVSFENVEFSVNGTDYSVQDAQRLIGPIAMKQLLNPAVYEKLLTQPYDNYAEKMDQPEQDDDGPDYDDRDEY